MSIVSSSGILVKRLLMSKEHIWSDEMELLCKVSTKFKESLTRILENFSETGFKTEIKNLAKIYWAEFS